MVDFDLRSANARLRASNPLIQCITNTVVQQFSANVLLAIGASPAMLDHEADAGQFAGIASGILVNFGTASNHQLLAADAAIGASYFAGDDPIAGPCDFIAGFHSACPLTEGEIALMPDLIAMRMLTTIVIASWRAVRYPENAAYILRNVPVQLAGLDRIEAVGADRLADALMTRCMEVQA